MRILNIKNVGGMPKISIAAAIVSAAMGLHYAVVYPNVATGITTWLFGLSLLLPSLCINWNETKSETSAKITAYIILLTSGISAYMRFDHISSALIIIAICAFFSGLKSALYCGPSVLVWNVALPLLDHIHFAISYPLRIIGAYIACYGLKVVGMDANVSGTSINLDGSEIAVTAMCSGIEQLEAMMLAGWIIAFLMQKTLLNAILHFSAILPVILIVNAIRLAFTIISTRFFGDTFLFGQAHEIVGIASIAIESAIFITLAPIFEKDKSK